MSTTDADLPAMPHIPVVEKATVDVLGGKVIVELVAKDMVEALLHNYARAAIEADRARAQPAPSVAVPYSAIGKLLVQAIEQAVRNGANSVSMPDEYVAIAAWLDASPQPPTQQEKS